MGAAYGTAKASLGVLAIGVMHPELIMKALLPAIMAGIVGLYGVILNMIMIDNIVFKNYSLYAGALHLGAGLCVGFSGLAAGIAIGVIGDAGVRGIAQQPRLFTGTLLLLIFSELLGIYGLIIGILMVEKAKNKVKP